MKLYHFTLLFVVLALATVVITDIKTQDLKAVVLIEKRLDHAFDNAVDDGVTDLLQADGSRGLVLNRDAAVESFYKSMYSSLGIMVAVDKQELLKAYVPVMAVTAEDGFYINYSDEFIGADGYTYYSKRWSEKMPYYYEDTNFVYGFTLGDTLTIYDKNKMLDPSGVKRVFYLDYHELQNDTLYQNFRNSFPTHFALNDESFILVKKEAIINALQSSMAYYVNRHNNIAEHYGITYNFSLPVIDNSDYVRSIDNTSFFVIFQGYPYGNGIDGTYNRVSIAGAKISKDTVYYLEQRSWYYLYHRSDCEVLELDTVIIDKTNPYYSIADCVSEGAYACNRCNENTGAHVPNYRR